MIHLDGEVYLACAFWDIRGSMGGQFTTFHPPLVFGDFTFLGEVAKNSLDPFSSFCIGLVFTGM